MQMYKLKLNDTAVYNEEIAIKMTGILSKFVWFGNVFYMPYYKDQIYIPANQHGWRWILDENDLSMQSSTLRLYSGEKSLSFIAIHFNKLDAAPHPLTFTLNVPEFLGNFVTLTVADEGEREKSMVHEITEPLEIGKYTIKFTDIKDKKVYFEVHG